MYKQVCLLSCLATGLLSAESPQPHAGWKLVPGGENLVSSNYWDAVFQAVDASISVSSGILTASAGSDYLGGPSFLGPRLYTSGDFGVGATVQLGPGMDGLISLTGSLPTGSEFWQGRTRIDFGVNANGDSIVDYWDGTRSSPVFYRSLKPGAGTPAAGTMTLELLRQNGQFLLYFNGTEYGPIPDPGLFLTRYVFAGFTVPPGQQFKISQFAFEAPQNDSHAQLTNTVGAIPFVHPGDSLRSLAAVTGRRFTVQVTPEQLSLGRYQPSDPGSTPDPAYAPKVAGEFGGFVAAQMYYFQTETAQNHFTFASGDALIADAKANGFEVHCHHLIGGDNQYTPAWVVNGGFSRAQLTQIMQNHIQAVVGHYKGQCETWDVVNEALAADGSVRTDNVWARVIGPDYIDLAFELAHHADPNAKLYYNDYRNENTTPRSNGMYKLVASMKQRGIPIDGVGLQCHWIPNNADFTPNHDQMVANMARFAGLGLSVRLSEIDVRLKLPVTPDQLTTQAALLSTTVQACLDSPNCISMNVWGADDRTSWIDSTYAGSGAATLFDKSFQPKPAYTSVMNTLRQAALAVPAAPKLTADGVVSSASYAKSVAPGEIVALFPANAGPAKIVNTGLDASNKILTEISDTRVLFDGTAAPMIYTVAGQVAAIVPYEVAGHTSTLVQVEYKGIQSVAVTVPVVDAAPALFTANSQGTGQAAANNQDGRPNSASNPAERNSTVVLFATGEGQRQPAGVDGALAAANEKPVLPVTLTAGGVTAKIAYAASAPGLAGLMQVNFTVPLTVTPGPAVPIVLTVGTEQSKAGVTIAVK